MRSAATRMPSAERPLTTTVAPSAAMALAIIDLFVALVLRGLLAN